MSLKRTLKSNKYGSKTPFSSMITISASKTPLKGVLSA
ncbi:hypothetical protein HPYSS1_05888 [Helicobacter pylori SS1]|nr:hypothetical protein HPYSS1_05888 [Helicobacter pylori SS1]